MVLVKAKRDEILGPLSAVSGIIERRHTLPILSNVLIDRSAEALSFLATDIEIQILARSAAGLAGEARAVTVGARKLVDILRALPEGVEVTLQQQDKRLLVKAGKSRFTLQTLPAEDFPRLAKPSGEVARFALGQKALRRLLGLVQYAMAQQDIRYYLNGLLMVVEDGQLKLVATNAEQEEAHEELEVKYSGDALDIGFNVNYLLDVLNNVSGSAIDCAFGDSSSSALLSYASEKDFKYVVMPMRI